MKYRFLVIQEEQQNNKRPRTKQKDEGRNVLLGKASAHLDSLSNKSKRDEACIFAEGWACSFRKLSEEQKLYAKKAIEEILILGQLKQLSLNCVTPTSSASSTPQTRSRTSTPLCSSSPLMITVPRYHFDNNASMVDSLSNNCEYSNITDLFSDSQYS